MNPSSNQVEQAIHPAMASNLDTPGGVRSRDWLGGVLACEEANGQAASPDVAPGESAGRTGCMENAVVLAIEDVLDAMEGAERPLGAMALLPGVCIPVPESANGTGASDLREDLATIVGVFPTSALLHVLANRHRLSSCRCGGRHDPLSLFGLLGEALPTRRWIELAVDLFTGSTGAAATRVVRWLGGERFERYGGMSFHSWCFVLECLEAAVAARCETAAVPID